MTSLQTHTAAMSVLYIHFHSRHVGQQIIIIRQNMQNVDKI